MHRLLTFIAACLVSSAMVFAQGTATDPAPPSGASPSNAQAQAPRTPSSSNQALPGDSNPQNAGTRDGQANGSAVRPKSNGGTPGTAAGSSATPPDSNDSNGVKRDDTGSNPAAGHTPTTNTNSGTMGRSQWFWIALGIFVALVLIGALVGRNRAATEIDETDPALRTRREPDVIRREEIYRARRDDLDRDEDDIRRAG